MADAKARKRQREAKRANEPTCETCGGHEFIVTRRGGKPLAKICVGCLTGGRRREIT